MNTRLLLAVSALCAGALPAHAQLGPELFGITHFFGGPDVTTVRGYGMGGAAATMGGVNSPNPAHAAYLDSYEASVRYGRTSFASGTRFDATFVAASVPLGKKDGLKFIYGDVRSPESASFASVVFPGSTQKFHEVSAGAFYGRQVTEKLSLGIGLAPLLLTNHRLKNVGAPGVDIEIEGKPLANSLKRLGGRFGADYKFAPWGRASVFYDNYWERAKIKVPTALAPTGLKSQSGDFHEVNLTAGVQIQPLRHLTLVAERQRITASSQTFNSKVHNTLLGAEYEVRPGVALRVGSNDGHSTFGLGLTRGQFNLQIARVKNYADDELRPIFGSGNKLTCVELGYTF